MKVRVDVEEIRRIKKERDNINKLSIYDIDFYENGKKLVIEKKLLDFHKFLGLNTMDFILRYIYKGRAKGLSLIIALKDGK